MHATMEIAMPSLKPLPAALIDDIDAYLEIHRSQCIDVYPHSEKMRREWEHLNIALEDIVYVFVERCGLHGVAVSFDRRAEVDVLSEDREEMPEDRKFG
jgi:hypothetical protein